MPVDVCLEMLAEKSVKLPFFTGYVSRGLFLHIIRMVDPSLADDLHRPDVPKPYSVTPLTFKSEGRVDDGYLVDPCFPVRVSFRFLEDSLFSKFLTYLYDRRELMIYDTVFKVSSLNVRSESYEDLLDCSKSPVEAFRLHFRTPTYLATLGSKYHYLFPDHLKIFPNLMRLWNSFSNRKFSKEEYIKYKEWLLKNMGISQHKLRTCMALMGSKKANGFIGWATYEISDKGKWNLITQTLAKFAEYSNIGGNRTGGFGVTKQKPQTNNTN